MGKQHGALDVVVFVVLSLKDSASPPGGGSSCRELALSGLNHPLPMSVFGQAVPSAQNTFPSSLPANTYLSFKSQLKFPCLWNASLPPLVPLVAWVRLVVTLTTLYLPG